MTKREVVKAALAFEKVPYVPWDFGFTCEAQEKLVEHYGTEDLEPIFDNHSCFYNGYGKPMEDVGNDHFKDRFGVIWDRGTDKDIGVISGQVLPEPTLDGYAFPKVFEDEARENISKGAEKNQDMYQVFAIGFSLYERAWTMRGMENLMMDFYDNPDFVHELLTAITDFNIAQVEEALEYDIDGVHFGDDWGQQHGLQMGPQLWHEFIYPQLKRIYGVVRDAGKDVSIHSCGDVDELFDDLVGIGLGCFNPFQPEVMDVDSLMKHYHGKLAFHGGLSTQKTLPYGTVDDVVAATNHLLELGANGGYIFAPAHAVEGDVPTENMVAFIETIHSQPGYQQN